MTRLLLLTVDYHFCYLDMQVPFVNKHKLVANSNWTLLKKNNPCTSEAESSKNKSSSGPSRALLMPHFLINLTVS